MSTAFAILLTTAVVVIVATTIGEILKVYKSAAKRNSADYL